MYPPLRRYRLFVVVAVAFVSIFLILKAHVREYPTPGTSFGPNPAAAVLQDSSDTSSSPGRPSFDVPAVADYFDGSQNFPQIELPGDKESEHVAGKPPSDDKVVPARPAETVPLYAPGHLKGEKLHYDDPVNIVEIPPSNAPIHWSSQTQHFPVPSTALIPLPTGKPKTLPRIQAAATGNAHGQRAAQSNRLRAVRDTYMKHWRGYEEFAWEHDELKPVSGGFSDPFAGWRATLVDSLDTLWIMGLEDEFHRAVNATKAIDFTTTSRQTLPLFEVVIRYLGGLLGGYDVSGQKYAVLLEKAEELAEVLMGAFDTPNRMPMTHFDWMPSAAKQPRRAPSQVVMAEIGSLSLEFTRLAQLTGKDKYYDAIARITNELEAMQHNTTLPGLWPLMIDASGACELNYNLLNQHSLSRGPAGTTGSEFEPARLVHSGPALSNQDHDSTGPSGVTSRLSSRQTSSDPTIQERRNGPANPPMDKCVKTGLTSAIGFSGNRFTLGGMADSTYEYLPKEYLLLGGLNNQYKTMHEYSTKVWKEYLLFKPMITDESRKILFTGEWMASGLQNEFTSHDSGSLKASTGHLDCFLGAYLGLGARAFGIEEDMDIAAHLTDACVWAYEQTPTGIMPENIELVPCPGVDKPCPWNETRWWEAVDPYAQDKIEWNRKLQEQEVQAPQAPKLPSLEDLAEQSSADNAAVGSNLKRAELSSLPPTKVVPGAASPFAQKSADFSTPTTLADMMNMTLSLNPVPRGMARIASNEYMLRPEAIESVFYMWRLTGDSYWRDKGWNMFEAIENATKTRYGNSAIWNVMTTPATHRDSAESFWTAETLKYFYLLFAETDLVSLDEYVFNTEAHPFRRPDSASA